MNQKRANELDTSKPVAVFYFYRVDPQTIPTRELQSYREVYGWRI